MSAASVEEHLDRCGTKPPYREDVDLKGIYSASIRAERARRGWSQEELARRAGVPRSEVSDLELGRRRAFIGDLVPYCEAFGVGLEVLLSGDHPDALRARRAFFPRSLRRPRAGDGAEA
jgi:transcriptional regulator with XRE-family HTH domain